jgi:phospholipid/cholesterol/gamma-HCH transport system permease protein
MSCLFARSIAACFKRPLRLKKIVEQMEVIGFNSLPIVILTALFTGMVLVLQTAISLTRFGVREQSGGIAAVAFARELGPVLTAVILSGRVCAGIAAEIGTMKVTEQIDAMQTLGTDPVRYLVVPRLIAATLMVPALCVFSNFIGFLGGYVVGVHHVGIPAGLFIQTAKARVTLSDAVSGIVKTPLFGMIIAVVGCYQGFRATGGAEGVGRATTRAVVASSILVLITNYIQTDLIIRFGGPFVEWVRGLF